jgi:hypothetical protein
MVWGPKLIHTHTIIVAYSYNYKKSVLMACVNQLMQNLARISYERALT